MTTTTIEIPAYAYNIIIAALYTSARADAEKGWDALARQDRAMAQTLRELNGESDEDGMLHSDRTEVGATCYCDQRDDDEIALYLKADELKAIEWALGNVTFGDLEDSHEDAGNVMSVHRAICEVQDKILDTE
jgi:hypothetical protein